MTTNKILIADSGATKTDWCLLHHHGEIIKRFQTKGFSPVFQSINEISEGLKKDVHPQVKDKMPEAIFFYGSGCTQKKAERVESAIQSVFPINTIKVYSDLIAATHALYGNKPGIACILGTGSNSCEWDGQKVINQTPPLGFILGDEGSGAQMGKQLVGDALKNQLPTLLKDKFLQQFNLTTEVIIENVYKKPFPSRFLASLTPFLFQNIQDASINKIVRKSFSDFFERNVVQYNHQAREISFVGSIAYHFANVLKEVALEKGFTIGQIDQSPMNGLIKYYQTTEL